jgi:hypothetical protein
MNTKTKKIIRNRPKKMSLTAPSQENQTYEKDFFKWANNQAKMLKKREFSQLDIDHLVEEIESLGRSERRALESYLENLLMHKLKVKYQPNMHTASWDASIKEATFKVRKLLHENPSLKPKLEAILHDAYYTARLKAVRETGLDEQVFPEKCEWNLKEILPNLKTKQK